MKTVENTFGTAADPRGGKPKQVSILGVVAAIATITSVGVAIGLSYPLLSFLLEQRGYSPTLIGANTAAAGVASIVTVPFVNPLARRLGVAFTLALSSVVAAASLMGFFFFPSIAAWFALRIVFHGALTASFILSEFWINSSAPDAKRGLVLGIYATVLSVGFATGPALLALLGTAGVMPFAVGTGIILLSILPALAAYAHQPELRSDKPTLPVWRFLWLVPLATMAAFVFGAVEQAGLALFPVYGARTGYTETQIALLLMALAFGNVVFQIPLGLVSDRMKDRSWLLFACAAAGAIGSISLPIIIDWPSALAVGVFIWGGVAAGLYTVGLVHLGARLSGSDLAQANAAFVLAYVIGMVAGPQLAGIAMDLANPHGFAYALAAMFGIYMVLIVFRRGREIVRK